MPSLQDFVAGFDPTGQISISASELLALIQNATPESDKGLTFVTTDIAGNPQVPDAITNPKWQNYLWIRIGASKVNVYVWNTNAATDITFAKWQSITISSIPAGSVVEFMIADGAVTAAKISSVSWGSIVGVPTIVVTGTAAGGDLTGTYPNPIIAPNAVDSVKLQSDAAVDANRAVSTNHIKDQVVTLSKIRVGTPFQIIRTAADGLAMEYDHQKILQIVEVNDSTAKNTALTFNSAAKPLFSGGAAYAELDTIFTPKSADSVLLVEAIINLGSTIGASQFLVAALFRDGAGANPADACAVQSSVATIDCMFATTIRAKFASAAAIATTFNIRFGANAGNSYVNRTSASAALYGNGMVSSLRITEYLA